MQSLAFSIASGGISSNRTRAVCSASCSVIPVIMFSFPLPTMLCAVRLCKLGRMGSRQAAEYRALHQTRSAGVIIEKRSAGNFSRGKESADHIAAGVFDLAFFRNADAAE